MKTLIELHRQRILEHEYGVCPQTEKHFVYTNRQFGQFIGHDPTVDDLNFEIVNRWIDSLRKGGEPSATIKHKRGNLLTLWRFAAEEGFCPPPRKVRKIRLEHRDPTAWTHAEVSRLVETALARDPWVAYPTEFLNDLKRLSEHLDPESIFREMQRLGWTASAGQKPLSSVAINSILRKLREGKPLYKCHQTVRWSIWFASFIATGWDSGLRLGDLMKVTKANIRRDPSGGGARLRVVQSKTRFPIECHLNPFTVRLIDRCLSEGDPDRDLIWPIANCRHVFHWQFHVLRIDAGVKEGTFKWIRRGAGSHAESLKFGGGTILLGHRSRDVTVRHYLDPRIAKPELFQMPSVEAHQDQ